MRIVITVCKYHAKKKNVHPNIIYKLDTLLCIVLHTDILKFLYWWCWNYIQKHQKHLKSDEGNRERARESITNKKHSTPTKPICIIEFETFLCFVCDMHCMHLYLVPKYTLTHTLRHTQRLHVENGLICWFSLFLFAFYFNITFFLKVIIDSTSHNGLA